MTDLEKLRALAMAATPGPWREWGREVEYGAVYIKHPDGRGGMLSVAQVISFDRREENASFIEAANPTTIISLLDRIAQLEGERDALRDSLDGVCERCQDRCKHQVVDPEFA